MGMYLRYNFVDHLLSYPSSGGCIEVGEWCFWVRMDGGFLSGDCRGLVRGVRRASYWIFPFQSG